MSTRPQHQALPGFFDRLLAPYALSRAERLMGRLLVSVLAIPGASVLLRAWHRRRSGQKTH
jgi:hypothetical protein